MTLSWTRRLIIHSFVWFPAMLDAVISLQSAVCFSTMETIWRHFWSSDNNNEDIDEKRIFPFVRTFVFFITGTVANFYYYVCFVQDQT